MSQLKQFDAIIVGGGLTGLGLGILLSRHGVRAVCIDRETPSVTLDQEFDGRTTAISYGSRLILAEAVIWPLIAADTCPINDIRIVNGKAPGFLHFDAADVGDNAFGFIIENRLLRRALYHAAAEAAHLTHLAPAAIANVTRDAHAMQVELQDGAVCRAPLLIAADGRKSFMRDWAGIESFSRDYEHDAIVCVVHHDQPHDHVALEHFLPSGPFASLPMTDDRQGHRSSLVWTVPRAQADLFMALAPTEFDAELQQRFGNWLGRVTCKTRRFRYPLGLTYARHFTADRMALLGDAAHGIHPIAGQGLNLGFRDVKALADLIASHHALGLDLGASALLRRYQKQRSADAASMALATDGLDRLFSNNLSSIGLLRQIGLQAVGKMPPVKSFFMRHAMGLNNSAARKAS